MKNNIQIGKLGEIKLIRLIEEIISTKTGKTLISDDSFFFDLNYTYLSCYNPLIINILVCLYGMR